MDKIGEIGPSPSFVASTFQNGLEYRNFDSKLSLAMIWLHRVKFSELWSSNHGADKGERCTPLVEQQFSYVRLAASLLDTAGSVLSFLER